MRDKPIRYLLAALLVLWSAVSFAALAGMGKLWWERERARYLGKSVEEQRRLIMETSGLPVSLVALASRLEERWPPDISYAARGDHNQLSYLKYLLIPRVPSGESQYVVDAEGNFSPESSGRLSINRVNRAPGVLAIFAPCFLLAGFALMLRRVWFPVSLSFPELFGVSLLFCHCSVVLSKYLLGSATPGFWLVSIAGAVGWVYLGVTRFFLLRNCALQNLGGTPPCAIQREQPVSFNRAFSVLCGVLIAFNLLWVLGMSVIVVPDDWDAWAIWAAKAKMLALGTGPLVDVSHFGHADYPLLWPALWAFSGWCAGGWEEMWSRGWGAVLLFLLVWEMAVIVKRLTNRAELALFSGALLLSVPMIPLIATWSYAEAPFWLLTLSCAGCLCLYSAGQRGGTLVVAALLAAAAAYTKNEGVMFTGIAALWILVSPGSQRLKAFAAFCAIACICCLPWLVWARYIMHFGSHATAGFHLDTENLHRVLGRIPIALEAIRNMWSDIKQWNIVLWILIISIVFGIRRGPWRHWLFLPLAMLGAYFLVVICHTAEVYWQVGTAWNRLTVHVLPFLMIVLILQIANVFPKALQDQSGRSSDISCNEGLGKVR